MNTLISGAKFPHHFASGGCLAERLEISPGTVVASKYVEQSEVFRDWARIPRDSWRSLTSRELYILTSTSKSQDIDIQIVRFPRDLTRNIRAYIGDVEEYKTKEEFSILESNSDYLRSLLAFDRCAEQYGQLTKRALVCANYPGLATTTTDTSNALIGLHVDNWYAYPAELRDTSPRRMCINIGDEPRYLLFLNIKVNQIFYLLNGIRQKQLHPAQIGTPTALDFMQEFPDYPVLRLRIEPEEGYLAPTENIVHDASTVEMSTWDLAVHIHGQFIV